jgi:hypothetical protein
MWDVPDHVRTSPPTTDIRQRLGVSVRRPAAPTTGVARADRGDHSGALYRDTGVCRWG